MKNDYAPSETGGLAWLADKGAREATYDGQGSLVSTGEKERAQSEYVRVGQRLYDFAKEWGGSDADVKLLLGLFADFPALYHQIREGVRDAEKAQAQQKREAEGAFFVAINPALHALNAKHRGNRASEIFREYRDLVSSNPPPSDHTANGGFTEEEIAAVKSWCKEVGFTYSEASERPFKGIPVFPNGQRLAAAIPEFRCKAIAEHLARVEGE